MAAAAKRAVNRDAELEEARQRARPGAIIVRGRDGEILTRKRDHTKDALHIPEELIDPDWDMQWCRKGILGQPDISNMNSHMENGWRPVMASRYPGRFMPNGHEGAIELGDLVLCERPMPLSVEARREQYALATGQKNQQKEQFGIPGEILKQGAFEAGERKIKRTLEGTAADWAPQLKIEDDE